MKQIQPQRDQPPARHQVSPDHVRTTDHGKPSVGFIGMGGMGSRMARRLLDAGYPLTIYNRARDRTHDLEALGATVAARPVTLASGCDFVFSSVADDAAIESVMSGQDGALAAATPETIFVDMSTVSPRTSRRLHQAALQKGVAFLDAPVSGTVSIAERGELVIFVGGEESAYQRCTPLLGALGKGSFYMGPSGAGAMMKLCVNTLLGVGMQALAEAIAFGLKGGLQRERLLEVIGSTAVVSRSQLSKLHNAAANEYPAEFPLRLMSKDFALIAETAMRLSAAMPSAAAAERMCAMESARQSAAGRDEDFSSIIRAMERIAVPDHGER